jgi:hypothetical protein
VCYEIVLRKLSAFCVHFQGNPSQVLIVNLWDSQCCWVVLMHQQQDKKICNNKIIK